MTKRLCAELRNSGVFRFLIAVFFSNFGSATEVRPTLCYERMCPMPSLHADRRTLIDTLSAFIRARVPVILIGHPGGTKSSTCRAIFRSFKWPYERVGIPSITDPILLSGLPSQDETTTRMKPYPWLESLIGFTGKNEFSGLIFDDLAEAPRAVQVALLDVLGENTIQEHYLEFTSMVGTANPLGGGLQITPSMANRVGHLMWSITPKEQAELMMGDYPNPEIPVFEENWEDRLPSVRRKIACFLDTLQDFDAPDLDAATAAITVGAYPTSRTWELSARVLAAIESSDLDAERAKNASILAVKSLVGDVSATAFFTFLAYPDMLRPDDVMRNPRCILERGELFEVDKVDRAYIFLSAMTKFVLHRNDVSSWKAGWQVLGFFAERDAIPIAMVYAMLLNKRRPKGAPNDPEGMSHFLELLEA